MDRRTSEREALRQDPIGNHLTKHFDQITDMSESSPSNQLIRFGVHLGNNGTPGVTTLSWFEE